VESREIKGRDGQGVFLEGGKPQRVAHGKKNSKRVIKTKGGSPGRGGGEVDKRTPLSAKTMTVLSGEKL